MSLFTNKQGGISLVRVGAVIAGLGILVAVVGYLLFQLDISRRRSPLDVRLYPGATTWFVEDYRSNARRVVYQAVGVTPEEVAGYYQTQLDNHLKSNTADPNREQCVRTPRIGEFQDYVIGSGNLPYFFRCVFDNSTMGATQTTTVTIQPGVRNDRADPPVDNEGMTIIEYEQVWAR
jgi:hypothetical protein